MEGERLVDLSYVCSFVRLANQGIWLWPLALIFHSEIVTFANERTNNPLLASIFLCNHAAKWQKK